MKRTVIIIAAIVVGFTAVGQNKADAVDNAMARNEERTDRKPLNVEVAEFLVKAADARMMDIEQGDLASVKGTTIGVKQYGETMVKDQNAMLKEIKELAGEREIALPKDMSNEKKEGRDDLAELSGEKFDKKFLKMMVIDHKRDLKMFRKAVKSDDEGVSEFAELYVPVIQSHLARAKALKKEA
jgi:putative membrane protein